MLAKWNKVLPFSIPFFSAWFLCSLSWYSSYLTVAADIFWISDKFPIFLTLELYIVWFLCFLFFVVFFFFFFFWLQSYFFLSTLTYLDILCSFLRFHLRYHSSLGSLYWLHHPQQFRVGPSPRKKARTYLSIFLCMCYSCYSVDINKLL